MPFWPPLGRRSLKGYRHGLCLRIEALCARRAAFWGPCLTRQGWPCDGKTWKRPESQAGSSAGPAPAVFSEKANLSGAAIVGWESGFSTAARTALWQGSDRSKKPDFFQIQPLARMLCALQQPVDSSHSGYPWGPLMRSWTRERCVRQEQGKLCLIGFSSPVSSYDNWFATEAARTSWDTKAWGCIILLGFEPLRWLIVIAEMY